MAAKMSRTTQLIAVLLVVSAIALINSCGGVGWDTWRSELYSPSQLVRLGETYFLVDCWHNRVLYHHEIDPDLDKWQVLDGDLAGPHSIATDGELNVVDDTGRHRLRVYRRTSKGFQHIQTVRDVGVRPHRVHYDEVTESFYVIGARSQTISRLVAGGGGLELLYTKELDFLEGRYTRSMSIIDDHMYFVSGPRRIHKTYHRDDSYDVVDSWAVPRAQAEMNDIFFYGGYYFLTATADWIGREFLDDNTIVQCERLEDWATGGCTDRKQELGLLGTPYYLTEIDGHLYLPQGFQYSGIHRFRLTDDGELVDVEVVFDSGLPTKASQWERRRLPK